MDTKGLGHFLDKEGDDRIEIDGNGDSGSPDGRTDVDQSEKWRRNLKSPRKTEQSVPSPPPHSPELSRVEGIGEIQIPKSS